jgi:hypothetical protein
MSSNKVEGSGGAARAHKPLDDLSSSQIGKRLKTMYDEVAREPVPDKFLSLLANLERAEKDRSNG